MHVEVTGLPPENHVNLTEHWQRALTWPYYHPDAALLQDAPYTRKDITW